MISLEGVGFRYAGSEGWALRGVTARIEKGEVVVVMGGNGAGKSTLLRTLNGLIPHFYPGEMEGKVVVDGVDTREVPVSEMARRVGLVFQNPEHMFFSETVLEEVGFGPKNLEVADPRAAAIEAMKAVGVDHLADRSPWSLSGGEKKRVAVASVLAMQPDYLALDEPTTGQDSESKLRLVEIIERLSTDGRGVIIVTHDVEWVVDLNPDRILLLSGGRLIADGEPRGILSRDELLGEANITPPVSYRVSALAGIGPCLSPSDVAEEVSRWLE